MEKIDKILTMIINKLQKTNTKQELKPQQEETKPTVQDNDNDFFHSKSNNEQQTINNVNNQQKKENNKNQKKKKYYIIASAILIYIVIRIFVSSSSSEINTNNEQEKIQIDTTRELNLEEEEEALKRLNNITTDIQNQDFIFWEKNVIANLGDANSVDFYLDGEYPQVITKNFKQDGIRNPIISGTDAKIDSIVFEQTENDFLNIVINIVSNDKSKKFELKYPLLKYVNLHFFEDSVVKVIGKNNIILAEDDKIFPYLKIEKISSDADGVYIILYVKQDSFGGKNFVFRYNIQKQGNE